MESDYKGFGARVQALLEHYGDGSVAGFADHVNTSRQTVRGWLKRDDPTPTAIKYITGALPMVSSKWLAMGKGPMFLSPDRDQKAAMELARAVETVVIPIFRKIKPSGASFDKETGFFAALPRAMMGLICDVEWEEKELALAYVPDEGGVNGLHLIDRFADLTLRRKGAYVLGLNDSSSSRLIVRYVTPLLGGGIQIAPQGAGNRSHSDQVLMPSDGQWINEATGRTVGVVALAQALWPEQGNQADAIGQLLYEIVRAQNPSLFT